MRLILLMVPMLLVCASGSAQEQDVSMTAKIVDNRPVINISNTHSSPIEAFLVTVDAAATNKPLTRIYYDIHSNYKHDLAIPAGSSKQLPLPHVVGEDLPVPSLRAVLFSDGTSFGDDASVKELLHRRSILSDRLQEVMALLQNISDRNLTREEALAVLQEARRARREATTFASPEERVWHDQVFYGAIRNLQPEPRVGGKVPELPRIIRALNKSYTDWLADLQAARPAPFKPAPPTGP